MLKDCRGIFATPLYTFTFENHSLLKEKAFDYLTNPSIYQKYTGYASHIRISEPNLHKQRAFQEYHQFMQNCMSYVMEDMGYLPNISTTAMWATRQQRGQFHHPHKHGNTFLAGVFYFHGNEITSGTDFLKPDNLLQISPARNRDLPEKMSARYTSDFVEGDFIVFPAWIMHGTSPNRALEDRYILGINTMPVGKTTDEPYDRFNYPDAGSLNLDFTPEELETYIKSTGLE
jgi:uncharacterized protein (TIGR02466 family)